MQTNNTPKRVFGPALFTLMALCPVSVPLAAEETVEEKEVVFKLPEGSVEEEATDETEAAEEGALTLTLESEDPGSVAEDEDILVLDDFVVSAEQDRGYYSANALAGTRTNQAIKDTPMTISVVNQELLNDLNLTEIDSLSKVVASAQSEGESFSNRLLRFRGLLTRFQLFEFMPRQGPQNSYNVDRVEVIRGANSLVYGQAAPGGKANFLGKKALFGRDLAKFQAEYGENDLFRATFDFNKEINEQWAVRVMGTHQELGFDQDFKENEFDGATAAITYRPSPRTSFRLHAEYFDAKLQNPRGVYKDRTGNYGVTGILENLPVTPDIVSLMPGKAMQSIIDYNDGTLQVNRAGNVPILVDPQLNIDSPNDLRRFYSSVDPGNSSTANLGEIELSQGQQELTVKLVSPSPALSSNPASLNHVCFNFIGS